MGRYHASGSALTDEMSPSSKAEAATIGTRGQLPPPPLPASFGYNPKLEFDEDDQAFGEDGAVPSTWRGLGALQGAQKAEPESGPSSGTGTKRKRPLKLTPSQRERKRAIDREAQRSIRIKTKNYIAHLENLVRVMERNDTAGPDGENSRTRELMNQLKQSQDEVRSLRETMLGVQRALSTVLGDSASMSLDSFLQRQSSNSASPPSLTEPHNTTSVTAPNQYSTQSQTTHISTSSQAPRNPSIVIIPTMPSQSEPPPPLPQDLPERPKSNPWRPRIEGEMFYYAEYHLNRVYAAGPAAFGNTAFDQDITVRAIIEGWAAVEVHHDLDLAWQVIREIDQVVWAACGIVERMAIISFMRRKLLYQINARAATPLPPMPAFMTQEVTKHARHADIIDHFIWPGFRNCLVEQPEKYISNHFSDKFRYNLKFLWPFEINSAYVKDPITQTYSSAPEFMTRQWDIRCWTMKGRFFDGSEELTSCIPAFDVPLHKALSLPSVEGMGMNDMGMNDMGNYASGLVEEQEVDEEGLNSSGGIVNDPNLNAGVGGGWHPISPSQNIHQYWNMGPNGTGMDQAYNGLVSHAGNGYPM
jgi:hypothetical protein